MRSSQVRSSTTTHRQWELSGEHEERVGRSYTDADEGFLEDHLRGGDEYHLPIKACRGCGVRVLVDELGLCFWCRFPDEVSPQEQAA